jgi:Leucine-rich repeat (LRR) protein
MHKLEIKGTNVSDLTPLASLTNLTILRVNDSPVTKQQVETLQKALPNCKIDREPFP